MTKSTKTAAALAPNPAEQSQAKAQNRIAERKTAAAPERGIAPIVQRALASPGQPLDPSLRSFMEPRFRHDFSRIRVHAGTEAARSAQALGARAYTAGRHIVLGDMPARESERRFAMAHELAHTIQQEHATPGAATVLGAEHGEAEAEADRAARAVIAGRVRPGIFQRASNVVMRLSGGAIAGIVGAVVGAAAIAGLIGGLVARSRRLMHWETKVPNAALAVDPAVDPPVSTALLAENTRLSVTSDIEKPVVANGQKWVGVKILLGPDTGKVGWIRLDQIESRPETGELSPEQARQVFDVLSHSSMPVTTPDGKSGTAPIPFGYPADGCYSRAFQMEEQLTAMGFASQKVFAVAGKRGIAVRSDNDDPAMHPHQPDAEPDSDVKWWYHVAPIVNVRDPERGVVETVIDPSMGPAPMTLEQWETLLTEGDKTRRTWVRLSLPEVRERIDENKRDQSDSSVSIAPRYAYDTADIDRDPSHEDAQNKDGKKRPAMSAYAQREPAAKLAGFIRRQLRNVVVALSAILDAIRGTTSAARKIFRETYVALIQTLHGRLKPEENAQVDQELNK